MTLSTSSEVESLVRAGTRPDAKSVIEFAREKGLKIVDVKFVDLPGQWQHFSLPVSALNAGFFNDGLGFDGSSIRGFQQIHESDMLLIPDPTTAIVDPVCKVPTLSIICDVVDPITHARYSRDPRHIARKAEAYLTSTGIAEKSYWGPELEFYIFNDVRFDQTSHSGYYFLDSEEGIWNSGKDEGPNLGYKPRHKEGYFPVPPIDKMQDLRSEIMLRLIEAGVDVEVHHHEVATAGQTEIDMRFDTLLKMADQVMLYKYVIKNVCYERGYTVTFMPKPLFQDNGSGMHVHQSLWTKDANLFYDVNGYSMLSDAARWYIGGLLKHAPALLAFAAPTTNSYRRLVPGYEAPINLVYSARNRSACVRIPVYSSSPKAKRIEFRPPDPSSNPYLTFAALLMAGLDGIQNKIEPPAPIDKDLYELEPEEAAKIKSTPGSLGEVLDALEKDHDFLLKGDVFTPDLIQTWIEYKRKRELEPVALRPHPYEFFLYYDI
ncbi:MAG: type I glutamate--ammonia ligase [Chloroflexota bacterium]|nr:MAG: type I glutamate--ammonia ligase [Chloroflexota bacterium]